MHLRDDRIKYYYLYTLGPIRLPFQSRFLSRPRNDLSRNKVPNIQLFPSK